MLNSKFLIALSITGIAFSVWFLQQTSELGDSPSGNSRALVQKTKGDVRLKRSKTFHWQSLSGKADAFSGDSVYTGKDSTAKLQFSEGAQGELMPGSLVVITEGAIELGQGEIVIDMEKAKGRAVKLKVGGKILNIAKSGTVRIVNQGSVSRAEFKPANKTGFETLHEGSTFALSTPLPLADEEKEIEVANEPPQKISQPVERVKAKGESKKEPPIKEAKLETKNLAPAKKPAKKKENKRMIVKKVEDKEPAQRKTRKPWRKLYLLLDSSSYDQDTGSQEGFQSAKSSATGLEGAARFESNALAFISFPLALELSSSLASGSGVEYSETNVSLEGIFQTQTLRMLNIEILAGALFRSYELTLPVLSNGEEKNATASSRYTSAVLTSRWSAYFKSKWNTQAWIQAKIPLVQGGLVVDYKLLTMLSRNTKWGFFGIYLESSIDTEKLDYESGSVTGETEISTTKTGLGLSYQILF